MAPSFSGVWKLQTKYQYNSAFPIDANLGAIGIVAGGQNNDSSGTVLNIIEKFLAAASTGNATDFGDLTVARHALSSIGNDTRAIFAGGWDNYSGTSRSNVIDYITYTTTGNATDFGDVAATTSDANSSASNNVRGITFGGRLYSDGTLSNSIEYLTIASTGNAIDFGDLSITTGTAANKARHRQGNGMSGSTTRGLASGGYTPSALSNVIQYVTIASAGDSTDFGDLSASTDELSFMSSNTRAVIAGGSGGGASIRNTIEYVTIASTGNVTDFGDMTVAKAYLMGASSSTKGFVIGGSTSGNLADTVNTIETITFSTTGNATDFGDLATLNRSGSANTSGHAAVQNEADFAPAAMGLIAGANVSGDAAGYQTTIQYLNLASTGNTAMFGDLNEGCMSSAGLGSATRGVFALGGTDSGESADNTIEFSVFATKGKATDFGDLTANRLWSSGTSNATIGLFGGGWESSASVNIIEKITIASAGNATDHGDLTQQRRGPAAVSNTTTAFFGGGYSSQATALSNVIDSVAFASSGDASDFGDLTTARQFSGGASSSTRGVFAGGQGNTIDYITMASAGNATDFGDLTASRTISSSLSDKTKGVFAGGVGSSDNTIDYITIASTGNASDFGDLLYGTQEAGGSASNSHGGLS